MSDQLLLKRIGMDTGTMAGKPVIRGTRLTVEYIMNLLAHGDESADILKEYPDLSAEDIQACLLFASLALESTTFMPLAKEVG
ncbi:MAG: DUF433 domain-containing protein [Rectinemataceae bacterium]